MRTTRTATTAAAFAVAAALSLTACGGSDGSGGKSAADKPATVEKQKKGGAVLDQPFEKPDLTLTDTHGKSYDMIEETKGHPTLLYFGYTNCPDICPLTMSNIAVAKSKLPKDEQKDLRVVFVTSDPKRDTPKELGKWLRGQDPSFIGLTGDFATIRAGARSVGVSLEPSYKKKNGDVVSTHGAQMLAFSPKDDKAHVLYTEGNTTPEILEKDLPKIIKGENP
ncbi:SCO family protein [Streptomyces sp. NBC_01795]|uniref:SCO family protein n=1 Tax=unclassified Streptomyces TaxID=2593676 RepID=UPI002DDBCB53|nr:MULTISPECIES: SCO family protein [unclassified Streptomyces]WSA93719.1 SCO family protein [Streptomyces sp. NBC_01795]WSB78091.1 SCO family protein [Streptomyces sp. NBC_01775]WSS13657.1 SCO family protein [Streptomyces sp. NBC_01186]